MYKVKHILRQNLTMSMNLFGFSTFYVVFGFLTHTKEKIDKKQHFCHHCEAAGYTDRPQTE